MSILLVTRKCIIYIEEQNTRKALASNKFRWRQSDSLITEERCSYWRRTEVRAYYGMGIYFS